MSRIQEGALSAEKTPVNPPAPTTLTPLTTPGSPTETTSWRDLPPVAEPLTVTEDWVPSQTFLRHHDDCARSAYLYMRHRGGAGSHALNRGSLFHETAERLLLLMTENDESEVPPELARTVLNEVMADHPEMQVPLAERDALRYLVHHFAVGGYFPNTIIGIETTFTLEVGGRRVLARADLVEDLGGGICQITDFKTSFAPDADSFVAQAYDHEGRPRFAGNFQLVVLAVLANFGVASDGLKLGDFERFRLNLVFPRELRPEGMVTRSIEVDQVQLATFREDLALQIERLEENLSSGKWQPTPGSHCAICPAPRECPLPAHLRADSQMAEAEEAEDLEQMATNAEFMSSRASALRRRIKKAAERIEEERPGALRLPNGDIGVRCGTDIAYVFVPYEKEEIRDRAQYEAEWEAVARGGPIPDPRKLKRIKSGTEFTKRKIGRG